MRPIRLLPVLMVCLLAMTLAACGGSSPAASPDGNDGQSAEASSQASTDDGGPGASQGNSGADDVEAVADGLVPPNSSEYSKTTAAGGIFVGYESTDSPDSLKSFYENAIPATGMQILTTSTSQGSYSWIFGEDDQGSSFGGSVTVAPSSTNEGGSTVIVTVASSN